MATLRNGTLHLAHEATGAPTHANLDTERGRADAER